MEKASGRAAILPMNVDNSRQALVLQKRRGRMVAAWTELDSSQHKVQVDGSPAKQASSGEAEVKFSSKSQQVLYHTYTYLPTCLPPGTSIYRLTNLPACLATLPQPTLKLHRWQRGEREEKCSKTSLLAASD